MKRIRSGQVLQPDNPSHRSKTFACMVVLPSGRWLCGYKAGPTKGDEAGQTACACFSDDQGQSWSDPYEPFSLTTFEGLPVVVRGVYFLPLGGQDVLAVCNIVDNSHPEKPYFQPELEGLKDTRILAAFSEDDGLTYGQPFPIPTRGIDTPTPLTGAPFFHQGHIHIPFEVNKPYDTPGEWIHRSCAVTLSSQDRTVSDPLVLTGVSGRYYWDQRFTVAGDRLFDYFWTYDAVAQTYLSVHGMEVVDGRPGSLFDLGIPGQPGYGAWVKDQLFLPVVDRTKSPKVVLYRSTDGRTFQEAALVYESGLHKQAVASLDMAGAWSEMALFSVGHPHALALPDGDVLVYYYAGPSTDVTEIAFVVLRP